MCSQVGEGNRGATTTEINHGSDQLQNVLPKACDTPQGMQQSWRHGASFLIKTNFIAVATKQQSSWHAAASEACSFGGTELHFLVYKPSFLHAQNTRQQLPRHGTALEARSSKGPGKQAYTAIFNPLQQATMD
eukprot:1158028-Pelagomonas_calceolata.AAC.2